MLYIRIGLVGFDRLAYKEVVVGTGCDLRKMRERNVLSVFCYFRKLAPDDKCRMTAYSGIDLVEYHGLDAV